MLCLSILRDLKLTNLVIVIQFLGPIFSSCAEKKGCSWFVLIDPRWTEEFVL